MAAARALVSTATLSAADVVRRSLEIAGEICVYTNQQPGHRRIEVKNLTPREIVEHLDRHIVGQDDAKRAVADGDP